MTLPVTGRQAANAARVLASWAFGLDLDIAPIQVDFEPTTRCNLSCRMCPHPVLTRPRGTLDPALFRRIVDETVSTTLEYHLDMMGEPLLHRDLLGMIDHAGRRGARVVLFTNLAVRSDALMRSLGSSPLDRVVVNLSALDPATYRTIHGRAFHDRLLRNLAALRAARGGTRRPRILVSWLVQDGYPGPDPATRARLRGLADEVLVSPAHDWLGTGGLPRPAMMGPAPSRHTRCTRPWASASILWDGRVATCCYDYDGRRILGDLRSATLHEVWNSPAMREFRRRHRSLEPCRGCTDPDPQVSTSNVGFLLKNRLFSR